MDETLFRDLVMHVRSHRNRQNLEASLSPGKVLGHNTISYDREFDPKGFYRYTFKPACDCAGLPGLRLTGSPHLRQALSGVPGAHDLRALCGDGP